MIELLHWAIKLRKLVRICQYISNLRVMKTISILFLSLNKVFCYSNNFQRIKVTSDSLVSYPLDTPRLARFVNMFVSNNFLAFNDWEASKLPRPSINHFSSLIDCTAQCNTKTGCDMFAFENSQDCLIGQGFDGNLIMDEDDGVPVYLRDPNVGKMNGFFCFYDYFYLSKNHGYHKNIP